MLKRIRFDRSHYVPIIIVLVFATIYCLISLVNHFNYRTHALDLSISNNALYDYSHFRWNSNPIMEKDNILSDHFSLYPLLLTPFAWIFGSATMLVFQVLSIILGGIGLYMLVKEKTANLFISNLALLFFYSLWGIYSALAFDYHEVVYSAMIVPWIFLSYQRGKKVQIVILFVLLLIGKENMALWGVFLMLGFSLLNFKDKKLRYLSLSLSVFAVIYFVVILNVVMPALFDEGMSYKHFRYSALGGGFGEALKTIVARPVYVLKLLFVNTTGNPHLDGIKAELHWVVLLSGGVFLIVKPQYLVMLIPIYAQKMFNDDMGKWGINSHYSIEFVPILAVATFDFIASLKKELFAKCLAIVAVLTCMGTTYSKLEHRKSLWYNKTEARFYEKRHYEVPFDRKVVRKALKTIPEEAIVCAQETLCPHLAFRELIYVMPKCRVDPEFVAFIPKSSNRYPFRTDEDYQTTLDGYLTSEEWEDWIVNEDIVILKRKN